MWQNKTLRLKKILAFLHASTFAVYAYNEQRNLFWCTDI